MATQKPDDAPDDAYDDFLEWTQEEEEEFLKILDKNDNSSPKEPEEAA